MTIALSPSLGYVASRVAHQPPAAKTVNRRTNGTAVAVAKVGAALAIATSALGLAAFNLGAHPIPASRATVPPAPQQHSVLGHGNLPALQLPAAVIDGSYL
jgi:hypothetical protein